MSAATHLIGSKVGEYEVIRRVGMGGMGAVYEGRHPLIGKRVAIKVLLPQYSEDEGQMKRFLAEARSVNEIRHRGIVDIFAFGQLPDGAHYFVMEFLEGTSFEQLLKTRQALPPVEALGLLEEVLDAVAAAHQANIVHRDLKPSNIFLVDIGRGRPYVKLLDFGVAKLANDEPGIPKAEATGIVGTPIYMAPEQVNGLRAGPEADIYALGVVLFELIAGRPPFKADSPVEMMTRHIDSKPPRLSELKPGVTPEVDRLVERMLAKRPQDRPSDAESLRAEVARLRSRLDVPVRRGLSPQQRAAMEEEVGPTMVRVIRRGEPNPTTPDITPIQSRSVGRVDPERTVIGDDAASQGTSNPELPWMGDEAVNTLDTANSDPNLGGQKTVIGEPVLTGRVTAKVTAESPAHAPEVPVPTLPVPAWEGPLPKFEKAAPLRKPTSHSSPTLSAIEDDEEEEAKKQAKKPPPPLPEPSLSSHPTDRQPSLMHIRNVAEARSARADARAQKQMGTRVLLMGLGAAGVVALAVLLLILSRLGR